MSSIHQTTAMLLNRLREETADQHQSVEALLDLVSPSLDCGQYRRRLQVLHAALLPLEDAIDQACPPGYRLLWSGRRKVARLAIDLAWLGAEPDLALTSAIPVPRLSDPSLWLGSLYVMEGSTLGGRVIARHLERQFGWSDGNGYRYFSGYGEETGERWREVTRALTGESVDGNRVVEGAHQTFDYLNRCMLARL